MNRPDALSRREVLAASMALPWVATPTFALAQADSARRQAGSKLLVAYFSRSGNARVIASQIRRARNADLFEIQSAAPYPEDYDETVAQAQRETKGNYEPPLKAMVTNLAGKTMIAFITHGGYGLGNSLSVLAAHAPRARLLDAGFSIQADQERQTLARVTRWLGEVQTKVAK